MMKQLVLAAIICLLLGLAISYALVLALQLVQPRLGMPTVDQYRGPDGDRFLVKWAALDRTVVLSASYAVIRDSFVQGPHAEEPVRLFGKLKDVVDKHDSVIIEEFGWPMRFGVSVIDFSTPSPLICGIGAGKERQYNFVTGQPLVIISEPFIIFPKPMWYGYFLIDGAVYGLVCFGCWNAIVLIYNRTISALRRRVAVSMRSSRDRCFACGYSMGEAPKCPECGASRIS